MACGSHEGAPLVPRWWLAGALEVALGSHRTRIADWHEGKRIGVDRAAVPWSMQIRGICVWGRSLGSLGELRMRRLLIRGG